MCVELTNGNERTSDGLRLGNEGEQRATVGMGMGVHGVWLVSTDIYQHQQEQQQQQRNHVDADGLDRERNVREKKVNSVLGMRQKIGQGREGMQGTVGGLAAALEIMATLCVGSVILMKIGKCCRFCCCSFCFHLPFLPPLLCTFIAPKTILTMSHAMRINFKMFP